MLLENRYEIKRLVHKAGVYSDYFAVENETEAEVHIRRFFYKKQVVGEPPWLEMFNRLGSQLTSLVHKRVTHVLESGYDEDGPFMITEVHSSSRVTDVYPKGMDNELFSDMVAQVLDGLQYIHSKKLQHAAIRPNSVKVDQTRGSNHFRIDDIGMHFAASLMNDEVYGLDDFTFMAPEMFENHATAFRSDMYMFGHLFFYYGACGHPLAGVPWHECEIAHKSGNMMRLEEVNSRIDPAWSNWIETLTVINPRERPSVSEAISSMPS